jgi:PKD repeat protein
MANQLNEFDRLIKETYESQDFPYDSSAWDGVEKELGTAAPGILDFFKSVTTGLALTGAVFATMLIFTTNTGSLMEQPESQEIISDETSSGDKTETYTSESSSFSKESDGKGSNEAGSSIKNTGGEIESESKMNNSETANPTENKNLTDEQKSTIAAVLAEAKKISKSGSSGDSNNSAEVNTVIEKNGSTSVKMGCTGLTIDFNAPEEYGSDAKYLWNFGDGFFSNEENPTHAFNKEGIFDVSLSVTAVGSGQISSNVVQAMIEVHEAPEARYDLEIGSMTEIVLKDISVNAINYAWLIDGEVNSPKSTDVLLSIADNTKFNIELAVENAGDCADTLTKEIHIIKAGNQFPQLYSSAYASDFAPGAIVDNGDVTDFRVFEKSSGEEVFKSTGSKGWNGKNKKGQEVAKGTYEWMMIVDTEDLFNVYHGTLNVR